MADDATTLNPALTLADEQPAPEPENAVAPPLDAPPEAQVFRRLGDQSASRVKPTYSSAEIFSAAFMDSNILGSLATSQSLRYGIFGGDESPISDDELNKGISEAGLADYVDRFLDVQTKGAFEARRDDIKRELENKQILADAGGMGLVAGLTAGIFDIPTLIPFGHMLRLGKAAETAYSTLGIAGRMAISSAVDATASEAALHSIQQTRTAEESAFNVGGSVILSSALGTAWVKAMNAAEVHGLGNRLKDGLKQIQTGEVEARLTSDKTKLLKNTQRASSGDVVMTPEGTPPRGGNPYDHAVGPHIREILDDGGEPWDKASQRMTPDQMALADTLGIANASKKIQNTALFGGNIQLNMAMAKSHSAREFIANITHIPIELKGNAEGINSPQSAMSMRAALDGSHAQAVNEFMAAYKQFRRGSDLSGKDLARFSRLVASANANGDKAPSFMAKNDKLDQAGAHAFENGMTDADWRQLSSTERVAIEMGAKASRTFFNEIADANVRAGLMRRLPTDPKSSAFVKRQADMAENGFGNGQSEGRGIVEGGEATGQVSRKPTSYDPARFMDSSTYLKHVYRRERLLHDEPEFIRLESQAWLQKWEIVNQRSARQLSGSAQKQLYKKAMKHAEGAYRAIIHGVDSEGQRPVGNSKGGNLRGSVLERNVMLPTSELLKRGWIEDDVLLLMGRALRQNGTDAMLATRFRRAPTVAEQNSVLKGDPDAYWLDGEDPTSIPDLAMAEPKLRIQQEYEALIREAKTDKERVALTKESELMLRHVDDAANILRGRYRPEDHLSTTGRALSVVREWNFTAKMGNILLSSLPDLGLHTLQHGTARVAGYALKRAKVRTKELLSGDAKSVARIRHEARVASVAIETENLTRIAGMADISDPFSQGWSTSPIERFSKNVVQMSSKALGITYWNNAQQRIAYGLFQDRVIRLALNPGGASKADTRWLAHLGINDKEFLDAVKTNVLAQADKGERGGVYFADVSTWDRKARDRFWAAARDSSRSSILAPEGLDKPLNLHSPVGSTLLQFTSYVFASTLRLTAHTVARLKIGDNGERASIALAMANIMAMSAMSIYLRFLAADKLDDLPDFDEHRGWWTWEIADRSGLLGLFSHVGNLSENAGFVSPRGGLETLFGDEPQQNTYHRSGPKSIVDTVIGPSGQTAKDVLNIAGDALRGNVDGGTVHSARRLTPLANAFWLRRIFSDPAEQYIDEDILGVPYDH